MYQPLEQKFLDILTSSKLSRFDASDQMPADVGAGTFWTEGVSLVNGDDTVRKRPTTSTLPGPAEPLSRRAEPERSG